MSFSRPEHTYRANLLNPARYTFQWAGKKGQLEYYDRATKERVPVPLPFTFIVLEELSCMAGYSKADASPYWSNEVRDTRRETLTVKTTSGTKQTGLYRELDAVRADGAVYAKSIYIAYENGPGNWVIGNIKAPAGSVLTAWIELSRTAKFSNGKIVLSRDKLRTAPTGDYYPPHFEYKPFEGREYTVSVRLDAELQSYLTQYFEPYSRGQQLSILPPAEPIDKNIGLATPEQIAEFERYKAGKQRGKRSNDILLGDIDVNDNDNAKIDAALNTLYPDDDIDPASIPF